MILLFLIFCRINFSFFYRFVNFIEKNEIGIDLRMVLCFDDDGSHGRHTKRILQLI